MNKSTTYSFKITEPYLKTDEFEREPAKIAGNNDKHFIRGLKKLSK